VDVNMSERDKRYSLRFGLIAAAVLLGSLAFAKVANSFMEPRWVEGIVAYASTQSVQDPNRVQPFLDEAKGVADALKAKNLFVKAQSKQHPVKQVDGILGQEALIANKWYKAGDKIGEAKIIAVESTRVTIEWDGKTKTFAPIAAAESKRSEPKPPEEKPKETKEETAESAPEAAVAAVQVVEEPIDDDPLAWMGVDLPPTVRAKVLEMWSGMSDEQKKKAKEDWNRMSEDEKQQAVDQMEQHM
jgi:hypothetical protein